MTQKKAVENWLEEFGSITSYDAFVDLGIMQLPHIICKLRRSGVNLVSEVMTRKTRYGKITSYNKYILVDK